MLRLSWLSPNPDSPFPPLETALKEPDGLLAAGGDLSPERLVNAYHQGIFPWFNEGEPILWWSPDPRCVLYPDQVKISRSLRKTLNKNLFEVRMDTAFESVMQACAETRKDQEGTWINTAMLEAYTRLHELGYAHSVECWQDNQLVGGLYGIAIGKVFCGESMFTRRSDASKVALVHLCQFLLQRQFELIDSQVYTSHLESLGAVMIPRNDYLDVLKQYTLEDDEPGKWDISMLSKA